MSAELTRHVMLMNAYNKLYLTDDEQSKRALLEAMSRDEVINDE